MFKLSIFKKKKIIFAIIPIVFFICVAVFGFWLWPKTQTLQSTLVSSGQAGEAINKSFSDASNLALQKTEAGFALTDNLIADSKDNIKIEFPATYDGNLVASLPGDLSISIKDNKGAKIAGRLLATQANQKDPAVVQYSIDNRKSIYYAYQKDPTTGERTLKNWILYKTAAATESESYQFSNANIFLNSEGDAIISYADASVETHSNASLHAMSWRVPKPFYIDKDGKRTDLNWKLDQKTGTLSVDFTASSGAYPIALDPTIVLKPSTANAAYQATPASLTSATLTDYQTVPFTTGNYVSVGTDDADYVTTTAANAFICGTSTVAGRSPDTTVYQTVLGEDGNCWLKSNLGTANVATAINDSTAFGWLYQWGRLTDGHQIPTSGTTTTQSSGDVPGNANFIKGHSDWRSTQNDALSTTWGGVNGTSSPCPVDWRLPTQTEWDTLTTAAGIKTCSSNCSVAANNTALKLTAAGYRSSGGTLVTQASNGFYWSSSPNSTYAYNLTFGSTSVDPASGNNRVNGFSVRCIQDYAPTYATNLYTYDLSNKTNISNLHIDLTAFATASVGNGVTAKIFNNNSNSWYALADLDNADNSMPNSFASQDITENITDYLDESGQVKIMVASTNPSTASVNAILNVDYVDLTATSASITNSASAWQATPANNTSTTLTNYKTTPFTTGNYVSANTDDSNYVVTTATHVPECGDAGYTVTDIDGNTYNTVLIGSQCWTKENMMTSKYPDGSSITRGSTDATWNGSDYGYYAYPPNIGNTAEESLANIQSGKLGFVYQWSAAMHGSTTAGAQGICPTSWHVPTDAEYMTMEESLGMCSGTGTGCSGSTGWRGTNQGSQLSTETSGGNNSSGFTAHLAGFRNAFGNLRSRSSNAIFWSSVESGGYAWRRYLASGIATVFRDTDFKAVAWSVRCLKN